MNITALFSRMVKNAKSRAGFTMIELLIVISILGILAVAVLSAINPIEQINRGRDTGSRSDAEQLLSAIDRYYAFNGYYPWQTGSTDTTNIERTWTVVNPAITGGDILDDNDCPLWEKLSLASTTGCVGSEELKESFFSRIHGSGYNYLFLSHGPNSSDSTYVCFAPKSNAFVTEAANRVAALPDDYPTSAVDNATDCGTGENCVCLP